MFELETEEDFNKCNNFPKNPVSYETEGGLDGFLVIIRNKSRYFVSKENCKNGLKIKIYRATGCSAEGYKCTDSDDYTCCSGLTCQYDGTRSYKCLSPQTTEGTTKFAHLSENNSKPVKSIKQDSESITEKTTEKTSTQNHKTYSNY